MKQCVRVTRAKIIVMKVKVIYVVIVISLTAVYQGIAQTDLNGKSMTWNECVEVYFEGKAPYCEEGESGIRLKFRNKCRETVYISLDLKLENGKKSNYGYSFAKSGHQFNVEKCNANGYEFKVCPKPEGGCK